MTKARPKEQDPPAESRRGPERCPCRFEWEGDAWSRCRHPPTARPMRWRQQRALEYGTEPLRLPSGLRCSTLPRGRPVAPRASQLHPRACSHRLRAEPRPQTSKCRQFQPAHAIISKFNYPAPLHPPSTPTHLHAPCHLKRGAHRPQTTPKPSPQPSACRARRVWGSCRSPRPWTLCPPPTPSLHTLGGFARRAARARRSLRGGMHLPSSHPTATVALVGCHAMHDAGAVRRTVAAPRISPCMREETRRPLSALSLAYARPAPHRTPPGQYGTSVQRGAGIGGRQGRVPRR
jgi:hypothetical protein